jgi:hypothetical protein
LHKILASVMFPNAFSMRAVFIVFWIVGLMKYSQYNDFITLLSSLKFCC